MTLKKKFYKFSRKIHKWFGLVLGLQVVIWIASGLLMSAMPIEKVRGKHLQGAKEKEEMDFSLYKVSLNTVLKAQTTSPKQVKFYRIQGQPVYDIQYEKETVILSGLDGSILAPLTMKEIEELAIAYHANPVAIASIQLLEAAPDEAAPVKGPVWQVVFDDWLDSTFYLHPKTGQLLRVRSDMWRLFDFVWMLHIMDYETRSNINNPMLILFAASGLIFALSGIVLLFQTVRFKRKRAG